MTGPLPIGLVCAPRATGLRLTLYLHSQQIRQCHLHTQMHGAAWLRENDDLRTM